MEVFLRNLVADIRVTDVIDIIVVTLIVYKVFGFIRETRAQQLVKGIVLLIVAFVLSDILNLYALNWILKSMMTIGVIALIIIFQPELRRGIEYLGRNKLLAGKITDLDEEYSRKITDEFITAINSLSKSKTGALIVLEREVSLGDITESGTVIDAVINAQIIENVFYSGAPLHDGALIVRGDRLYAAGCVLPLTNNLDIKKELGTRHRAGIGITENSDAITVMVSEETGVVSVAQGGKLKRYIDEKELSNMIFELYSVEEDSKKSIWKRLRKMIGGNSNAE